MNPLVSAIETHINTLSQVIGPRPSGSAGNHAAAQYITEQMRRLGLTVETQSFDCPDWSCDSAAMTLGGRLIEVLPNPYSPACDLAAHLVPVCTLAELERADIGGKIVVMYGDLTRAPLACKGWFLKDERDTRIVERLEEGAPAAVLAVQSRPGSTNRLIEDWEFTIPSATLTNENGLLVMQNWEQEASLRIQTRQQPGKTANLVGRRAGSRRETIILCAHYDTKIDTPGAGDNAAGVAAMLAAATLCLQDDLDCGLECIAFTNEEYLPIGDDTYLQLVGEDHLQDVLLAINFDGLGFALDGTSLAVYNASTDFERLVVEINERYPAVYRVDPWPESNHSTFSWRGVPALALSSRGLLFYNHEQDDSSRWFSPGHVEIGACLVADVVKAVASLPVSWLRMK